MGIYDLCGKKDYMSNPAFMTVIIEGDKCELNKLYGIMKRLQEREKPLVENGFYYPTRWLGNLVVRLGADWREVYCRGTWNDLELKKDHISFLTETAWQPPFELLKLVKERYPKLRIIFEAEGDDWDWYLTNDAEGKYFSSRYVVDMEPDTEYFDTIEEACDRVGNYIGKIITSSFKALYEAAEDWNEAHPNANWPIDVKEIKVISDEK